MNIATPDNKVKFALKKQLQATESVLKNADELYNRIKELETTALPRCRERCYTLYQRHQAAGAMAGAYLQAFTGKAGILPSLQRLLGLERYRDPGELDSGPLRDKRLVWEQDVRLQLQRMEHFLSTPHSSGISKAQYYHNLGNVALDSGLKTEFLRLRQDVVRTAKVAGGKSMDANAFGKLHRELVLLTRQLEASVACLRREEENLARELRRIEGVAREKSRELELLESDSTGRMYAALYTALAPLASAAGEGGLPLDEMSGAVAAASGFHYAYAEDLPAQQQSLYFQVVDGGDGYPALLREGGLVLPGGMPASFQPAPGGEADR